jgi:hypothetical protein
MILTERRFLVLACAFFLAVKCFWILLPVQVMGIPRLGDDGLVYLWTGVSTVLEPKMDTPAVQDIIALRQLTGSDDPELDFLRARTTMRVTYVTASPFAMITGALVHAGLPPAIAFAGAELIVAVALAAGIAGLGAVLCGSAAGAAALAVLAFCVLPQQGLHYLVPGVLALSLSLIILTELCKAQPRAGLVLAAAVILVLTHAIGLVYLCICLAFALLLPLARQRKSMPEWKMPAVLVLAGLAAAAAAMLAGVRAPATSGTGTLSVDAILLNLGAAAGFAGQSMADLPVIWGLGCIGFVLLVRERRLEPVLLLGLFLAVFGVASLFDINGYPGELASRILVPIVILLACAAGHVAVRAYRAGRWMLTGVAALFGMQMTVQAHATWHLLADNMNSRAEILDPAAIRTDLAALPQDAVILWTDPDISMMAAFLEGAARFHALPYPMIERSPMRDALIARARPGFIAATIPKGLNTSARSGSTRFAGRRYGVDFEDFQSAHIRLQGDAADRIHLRFSRPVDEAGLQISAAGGGDACRLHRDGVQSLHGGIWVSLHLESCSAGTVVTIRPQESDVALLGFSLAPPRARVNWPWGTQALLTAQARDPGHSNAAFLFGWQDLLGPYLAENANPLVLSDDSGIVWLRADFAMPHGEGIAAQPDSPATGAGL